MTDLPAESPLRPSRRSLFAGAAVVGTALTLAGCGSDKDDDTGAAPPRPKGQRTMIGEPFERHDTVRVGVIGLGHRGRVVTHLWAAVPGCTVTAVCDIRADRATNMAAALAADGHPEPAAIGGSDDSYKELVARDDVDFVYIATPWEFHHDQGKAALEHGKHVGLELPIATELKDLWSLVDASEKHRRHVLLMENCNYDRNETAMLRMAHAGILGDITSGHGGYMHDLRSRLFDDNYYTDAWRRLWHTRSIASFYPMHGLAPISNCLDINRGDRYVSMQAVATQARGLAEYRERHVPKSHPSWEETYINGDLVTCLITTELGRTIRVEHAVSAPRPYSRINTLVGSLGIIENTPDRVYLEPGHTDDVWRDFANYGSKYQHWLWRDVGAEAERQGGHGGMDYIMVWRMVQQMRTGQVPDYDVYDAAAWCSPVPLSVTAQETAAAVAMPDFTRGDWQKYRPGLDAPATAMPR